MVRQILQEKSIDIKYEFGDNFGIIELNPAEIKLLDKNANVMKSETFKLLVKNIERDKGLSTIPFVVYQDGSFIVISGNHRVKACLKLGIDKIPCIISLKEMSQDDILRIQLSHNSIHGVDDKDILNELLNSFSDINLQELAGITKDYFKELEKFDKVKLESLDFDIKEVVLYFNEPNLESLKENIQEIIASDGYVALLNETKNKDFNISMKSILKGFNLDHIINLNIVLPILTEILAKYCNNRDIEHINDICLDGMKEIHIGSMQTMIEEVKYIELRDNIKKVGGLDIAIDMFNDFLKNEYKK